MTRALRLHLRLRLAQVRAGEPLTEVFAALPSLVAGLVMAAPGSTFATSRAVSALDWMGEPAWAALFLGHAALGFGAWVAGGTRARALATLVGSWIWICVPTMFVVAAPAGFGWVNFAHGAMNVLAHLRVAGRRGRDGQGLPVC